MGTSKFSKLSDKEFMNLIKNAPLVSIDLIVKNKKDEVLLGLRKNAPAKGTWFVPGGRIGKNETLQEAFKRIANNELKLKLALKDAKFLGIFEHFYKNENRFEKKGLGTHYLVLAYIVKVSKKHLSKNDQHSIYKWFKIDELLKDNNVHSNTKTFFTESYSIPNDSGFYRALVSHYIHYDRQFWSRTQIILAVQGAALIGGYNLRSFRLGPAITLGAFFITLIVWRLIFRDINNSRINQDIMDKLASKILNYTGTKRVVCLRSNPLLPWWLSGRYLIHYAFSALLILNLFLAVFYWKHPNSFPSEASTTIQKLEDQVKELFYRLDSVEKNLSENKNLPKTNKAWQQQFEKEPNAVSRN